MPDNALRAFMMRDVLCGSYRASGSENKKPTWASGRSRLRERFWFEAQVSLAHPGLPPIHRGRSRPGWRSRLFYGQLVPDATPNVQIIFESSSFFLGLFLVEESTPRT